MGLFSNKKEIERLKDEGRKKDKRIKELEDLCEEKDSFFKELISDSLRHGSSLGAKHMSDRKSYLKGK